MDSDSSVKSRRFEDPNILALVVRSWNLEFCALKALLDRFDLLLQFELHWQG